jgi:hypothetical protein
MKYAQICFWLTYEDSGDHAAAFTLRKKMESPTSKKPAAASVWQQLVQYLTYICFSSMQRMGQILKGSDDDAYL